MTGGEKGKSRDAGTEPADLYIFPSLLPLSSPSGVYTPTFPTALSADGITDLFRFLRGLQDRLSRLRQQPAARELERITTLRAAIQPDFYPSMSRRSFSEGGSTPHRSPGEGGYTRHLTTPAWLAYGLLLSEYRLSIFAPALAQKGRASVKELQAAGETLRP